MSDGEQDNKTELEQLRLKYDFWKFIAGSVVVVLITAILNWTISWAQLQFDRQQKQQELELKRVQNEQDFMGKFIEQAMDANLETRIRFSHYFASLTNPQEQQGQRWDDYHQTLLQTATRVSEELGTKNSTATAVAVLQATATVQAQITAVHVDQQIKENPTEFAPTATQLAIESEEKGEQLQIAQRQVQQEIQLLESELTRQVTPTPPPPPTSIPTSTPIPTLTPTYTPTPTATPTPLSCSYNREPFATLWEENKTGLGCPQETRFGPYAWQRFENGDVFWSNPLDLFIIAKDDQTWRRVFGEDLPDPDSGCPAESQNLRGAMRRLSCSDQGVDLGEPESDEQNGAIAFQDFDKGAIWVNERRSENFVFFDDGTYSGPQR